MIKVYKIKISLCHLMSIFISPDTMNRPHMGSPVSRLGKSGVTKVTPVGSQFQMNSVDMPVKLGGEELVAVRTFSAVSKSTFTFRTFNCSTARICRDVCVVMEIMLKNAFMDTCFVDNLISESTVR